MHPSRPSPPASPILRAGYLLACLAMIILGGCGQGEQAGKAAQGPAVPVGLAKVQSQDVPLVLKAVGVVEAVVSVKVTPQVSGQILAAHFKEGGLVKKNDPLFTIDPRSYDTSLKVARANLKKDQAQLHEAQQELSRKEPLVGRQFLSQQDYLQLVAKVASQAATVEADQAQVEKAELELSYCRITAPISGRVDRIMIQPGSYVTAGGSNTLVEISSLAPIYVRFALPESDLAALRKQMSLGQLKVEAWPLGYGAPPVIGHLEFLANEVNQNTGTILARALFTNEDAELWRGQSVQVAVTLSMQRDAVTIPGVAVQQGPQGDLVFVVADGVAQVRPVKVARSVDSQVIIAEGLKPGEEVVTDGQLLLYPGARVAPKELPGLEQSLKAQKEVPGAKGQGQSTAAPAAK